MLELAEVNKITDFSPLQTVDFAKEMLKAPPAPCPVIHRFGPGVYIREGSYSAGMLVVGREHAGPHLNILLKGRLNVVAGDGKTACLTAPFIFTAPPGKKVVYILDDVTWQNIYAIEGTDVEAIEKTIFKEEEFLLDHLAEQLRKEIPLHGQDREDFLEVLKETGWSKEEADRISSYREDCIPLPYGDYKIASSDSPIHGKGFFATAEIQEGELIAPMRIAGKRTPVGYLVNHAKTPNSKAVLSSNGDIYLVALTSIQGMFGGCLGEEITLDYRQIMKLNGLYKESRLCLAQL